jgi:hypothetical protein
MVRGLIPAAMCFGTALFVGFNYRQVPDVVGDGPGVLILGAGRDCAGREGVALRKAGAVTGVDTSRWRWEWASLSARVRSRWRAVRRGRRS